MVLKSIKKEYRINLVAEIMARGIARGSCADRYLRDCFNVYNNPQSLIDMPTWSESAKGFNYWRQAFNEHGHEQR
jgi:hypothetical protein